MRRGNSLKSVPIFQTRPVEIVRGLQVAALQQEFDGRNNRQDRFERPCLSSIRGFSEQTGGVAGEAFLAKHPAAKMVAEDGVAGVSALAFGTGIVG